MCGAGGGVRAGPPGPGQARSGQRVAGAEHPVGVEPVLDRRAGARRPRAPRRRGPRPAPDTSPGKLTEPAGRRPRRQRGEHPSLHGGHDPGQPGTAGPTTEHRRGAVPAGDRVGDRRADGPAPRPSAAPRQRSAGPPRRGRRSPAACSMAPSGQLPRRASPLPDRHRLHRVHGPTLSSLVGRMP